MLHRPSVSSLALALGIALSALGVACEKKEPMRGASVTATSSPTPSEPMTSIHALTLNRLDGTPESLAIYEGKVLLVVNTASECGYTPQYEGLEALHEKYAARGFAVLGFPSNDFGGQEPGSSTEIATFCHSKYGVRFPMFAKIETTGPGRSALYTLLATNLGAPTWNFYKYLVDKRGVPMKAFPSGTAPDAPELASAIEAALAAP